ncbi:MAG: phosphoribosylamine--glycine ligase [Alphaproteobacteria bacterium]|jgi:phosphoribosylamine--glycine ligase|nr:phosphoribosylamine--glycine ligase [Alphaproteobacteria bacterium]
MNILVIGSGAREHALAWKIARSDLVDEVWSAPGNPGMDAIGPCFDVAADDVEALEKLTLQLEPHLVVIGPEAPLAAGLADRLRARGFDVFGPDRAAARLESSKAFSKAQMEKFGVPTAACKTVSDPETAKAYLATLDAPYVLKADGLAAGKGVVIADTLEEAAAEAEALLAGRFGPASQSLVIEEFMPGEEASIFVLTDGEGMILMPAVQDHKRAGEGDTGPNTGGMGAYVPAPVITPELAGRIRAEIAAPMIAGMADDGMTYRGVLYIGLMITPDGPKVVEFNARFGDPECQALMAGLPGDIVPGLLAAATGGVKGNEAAFEALMGLDEFCPAATVVMASQGYPGPYEKGAVIRGVDAAQEQDGVTVFQAGTDINGDGQLISAGGRVLSVTATGATLEEALMRAYSGVDAIAWPEGFCRRDIAWRVRSGMTKAG